MSQDAMAPQSTARTRHVLRVVAARLLVTAGPDRGLAVAMNEGGLRIGTSPDCDLRLSDSMVSRLHLDLMPTAEGLRLVDLGSSNGTWLGGARIREALLSQDALLTLGSTSIAISFDSEALEVDVSDRSRFGRAIGFSRAMRHVFHLAEQAAATQATVLLEGESGTGKDIIAVSLHEESERRDGALVVVDCGAISENLIESELFGHEKGAFTGAQSTRIGAFEQAAGGTLFLDEIGELPLSLQPKLLRVLENRSFKRVGGNREIKTDVRIVAATNRNLREAVKAGTFREDLYYRLSVLQIKVPPLAQRIEDVPPLAEHFLRTITNDEYARVPPELVALLGAYHWPGNARELRNVVERFATYQRADPLTLFGTRELKALGDPNAIDVRELIGLPYHEAKRQLLEAFHNKFLPRVLDRAGGSVSRAAQLLEIPRPSVSRMLSALAQRGDARRTLAPPAGSD